MNLIKIHRTSIVVLCIVAHCFGTGRLRVTSTRNSRYEIGRTRLPAELDSVISPNVGIYL